MTARPVAHDRRRRLGAVLWIVVVTVLLMGCSLLTPEEQDESERALREDWRPQEEEVVQEADTPAEPDQVLASGKVLSVRVRYGEAVGTQCTVRIENPRNGWYDYIEMTSSESPLYTQGQGYDDFDFGSTNFNKQLTDTQYYDPKDAAGEYQLTVTSSGGYSASRTIKWTDDAFSPNLLSFSAE